MTLVLSKSTQISEIKKDTLEIADSILEQSNKDLDKLATKADITLLKEDIVATKIAF